MAYIHVHVHVTCTFVLMDFSIPPPLVAGQFDSPGW